MIDGWITFWGWVLILTLGIFTGLAIAVTIGGFFDIRTLLHKMDEQHRRATDNEPPPPAARPVHKAQDDA